MQQRSKTLRKKPTAGGAQADASQGPRGTSTLNKASTFQERAVPAPSFGQKGQGPANEETKRPAAAQRRGGQTHGQEDADPSSILKGNLPYHQQLEQLRDSYIVYKEQSSRCKIQLRPKQIGEQFKRYYFQPKVPFLEDPEKQKIYRKNFVSEVSRLPEPEPLYLLADKLHLDCLETIADRSNPAAMREDLARFYMRRTAQLQHKKYKLLLRWANSQLRSQELDQVHHAMDRHLGLLQLEQDSCNNRLERLVPDDKYEGAAEAERPSPTTTIKHEPSDAQEASATGEMTDIKAEAYKEQLTKLYVEKTETPSVNSAIRQDDFEVYLRQKTYRNKLDRLAHKLIHKVKWLPYLKRFELWRESREALLGYRERASTERSLLVKRISIDIRNKLARLGEQDDKAISAVTERYIFHLKEDQFISRMDQILQSHRTDIKRPYMLFASNCELKAKIAELARGFGKLSCEQIDIDSGQQFNYQMQTRFPIEFERQVVLGQYDVEDSGKDPDRQLIERLVKNLGLSRDEILRELSRYAEKQRRNSILGALGYDAQIGKAEDEHIAGAERADSHAAFSEQNLIRKLKTIEFFTLNELKLKLRHADWLQYVCFEPAISEAQKQQNVLLSSSDNHIDHLLKGAFDVTDVHDQVSVNKILEDAAQSHFTKITALQHKITQGSGSAHKQISGREAGTVGLQASLTAAMKPGQAKQAAAQAATAHDLDKAQLQRFEHLQNIDQLNLSLVKNYYSLRLLKSRELKQKLLSLVNYFRAVQRFLALDLKEHLTREKAVGESKDLIEPHFGRDGSGKPLAKRAHQSGPGRVCAVDLGRKLDSADHEPGSTDPVTINCYKYRGLFNAQTLSTSPMLPKHHRTFGRPNLYESVAAEVDRKTAVRSPEEMRCLMVKRDRIVVDEEKQRVRVLNEFAQPIVYSEAITDLVALEEELIKIGSYFINQHEYLQANNDIEAAAATAGGKGSEPNARPSSMIDRPEMALDLLKCELDFQFSKVKLIEKLLGVYEHIYDPLESVRCLQMIVDAMAVRPRINTEASMYNDSYESETKLMREKEAFFSDVIGLQTDIEKQENKAAYDFQELKVTRVCEAVAEEFKLVDPEKTARVGSDEADPGAVSDEQFRLEKGLRQKLEGAQAKQDALREIQQKHITEFANEQYTTFAQVLGLPEISMEDLASKRDQKEPIIQDAIREQAFFTKQLEGYPSYFTGEKFQGATLGLHMDQVGLLDFFESLAIVPKINASLFQAYEALSDALKPENGLACSVLETGLVQGARLALAEQRDMFLNGGHDTATLGQNHLEEDFYFANSDKVLFAMKQFKAEMDPVNLYETADPLVVSKLDITSVGHYNFPRINMSEVRQSLESDPDPVLQAGGVANANDAIVRRMIELARDSSARQLVDKRDRVESPCEDDDDFARIGADDNQVRSPSMMRMACNVMEVIRLREELIQRVSECNQLTALYTKQMGLASKDARVNHPDQIAFSTSGILKDRVNIVDANHGKNKAFGLPFMEFDPALAINLDLKSSSCIKALMTDLGVEELRAMLHYQIMHQQVLTVAVLTNQLLLDGPMRGLSELELLERDIVVPNPMTSPSDILVSATDAHSRRIILEEKTRFKSCISEIGNDCLYQVLTKKSRDRDIVLKKFQAVQSRVVQSQEFKPELRLRILRSYRVKLLHEFCKNVLQEVYSDSIKVQALQTGNALRQKAALLPTSQEGRLFTLTEGAVKENLSIHAQRQLYDQSLEGQGRTTNTVSEILNGQIVNSSLFYIPHSYEIMMTDRLQVHQMQARQQEWLAQTEIELTAFDQQIKQMVLRPEMLNEPFQPGISHLKELSAATDKKSFIEPTVLPQNKVMAQIQQMSGASVKRQEESRHQLYKIEPQSKARYGYRKVTFAQSYDYGHRDIFRLLTYMSLVLRIFTLEYLMGRNSSPGRMVLEMERKVLTGQEFWTAIDRENNKSDINALRYGDRSEEIKHSLVDNETAAGRVIDRILQRKRVWHELREDMNTLRTRLGRVDELAKDLPHEKRTIHHLNDLLVLQHHALFYTFLHGLENILEIYRDRHNDEGFGKVMEVRDMAIKRQQGLILNLKNGFYVTQAGTHPGHISVQASDVQDFAAFMQQYHPVIDERALIPKHVNMAQRIYGVSSDLDTMSRDCLLDSWMANYANLQNVFYNLDDRARRQIGTNFPQLDELKQNFLIYKGVIEAPQPKQTETSPLLGPDSGDEAAAPRVLMRKGQNYTTEYLLATVEILSFKIEAAHLQRVLMGWLSGEGKVPEDTKLYAELKREYEKETTMRMLQERDHLNEVYFVGERPTQDESKKRESPSPEAQRRERVAWLSPELQRSAKFSFFNRVNMIRAETNVIKRLLDQKLIQIGITMIRNEHSALQAAIDFAGSQDLVQPFVHPQQQFASTMLQEVDKLGHLDIVQKMGFVQQFLTRLRNRCTEVDTLTSGPGIVFSMKDFNECISIFCKQALKFSEEALRRRTESSAIMANQYRHIIYLKEMEIVYFRSKCEQFLRNIDVIVNTKMSAKGNQMIYELDVTNRELRTLKDHYYQMGDFLREEIRRELEAELQGKDDEIKKQREKFQDHQEYMGNYFKFECTDLLHKASEDTELAVQEWARKEKLRVQLATNPNKGRRDISDAEYAKEKATPENYEVILSLIDKFRRQRALNMMRRVITQEKHQREKKELELKLTLNASLWEQLGESQKREQITRQELELTKRNLTHYEKLIERLYVQLEQLNNEKVRLQRYKSTNQKKINELGEKMKDLEILENIDLDKILTEMRLRDKKIERLQQVDDEFQNRMGTQERQAANQVRHAEKLLAQEREAKNEAFAKLESMRIEMKALEGTDIKNDLWKDKCKELYEISKDLEVENDGLRAGLKQLQSEKGELQRVNEQVLAQQRQGLNFMARNASQVIHNTEPSLQPHQTIAVAPSRNPAMAMTKTAAVRENMILNRKALLKPMTAKAGTYGAKRAQSGNPGAAKVANRLFPRNMTNAQSYHYERGQMGSMGADPIQGQTLLSDNTSYPAFSSEAELNSIGVRQGGPAQRNLMIGGANTAAGSSNQYSTAQQNAHHRYSAVGPQGKASQNLGSARKQYTAQGYAQSTRAMGQSAGKGANVAGNQMSVRVQGVLQGNVIQSQQSNFTGSANNSGLNLGTMPVGQQSSGPGGSLGPIPQPGNRLHTSQGGRVGGQRQRTGPNMIRSGINSTYHQQAFGSQNMVGMGIVGNTLQQTTFADSADIEIESKQIAISGSMPHITKDAVNIEQAEFAMQQEIQYNSGAQFIRSDPRQSDTR